MNRLGFGSDELPLRPVLSYRNAAEANAQTVAQSQRDVTNVTIIRSPLVNGVMLSWSDGLGRDGGS